MPQDPAVFLAAANDIVTEDASQEQANEEPIKGMGASYNFEAMLEEELRRQHLLQQV